MKRLIRTILLIMFGFIVLGCQSKQVENEHTALEGADRTDQVVSIPAEIEFLTMDETAKQTLYAALDKVGTYSQSTLKTTDYSNIEEIASETDYVEFLEENQDQAKIIYIGFDECPWCKAFSPKINQFASEFDLPIYYYNTRSRSEDLTYNQVMENFGVETVPYAFIMYKGEPMERINHMSSMQQIEDFFKRFDENYREN